jgi:hypothetical protein
MENLTQLFQYSDEDDDPYNGTIVFAATQIGEGGCSVMDYILLRGEQHYGEIWVRYDDERIEFGYKNFEEYLRVKYKM